MIIMSWRISDAVDRRFSAIGYFILFILILIFVMRAHLAWIMEVNWDEFHNLAYVYENLRAENSVLFQTLFVHAFAWLPVVGINEVDQVVAARQVMLLLGIGTALLIYCVARRYMSEDSALFTVLCYLGFSFVLRNANSFRTDTMVTFLLMGAIALVVYPRLSYARSIVAGGLIGLAGAITIKSVLYVPTIGMLLLIYLISSESRRSALGVLALTTISAVMSFMALLALHSMTLMKVDSPMDFIGRSVGKTIIDGGFGNAFMIFRASVAQNAFIWVAVFCGLVLSIFNVMMAGFYERLRAFTIMAFGLSLVSLLLYANSHPYYYVFMLAPAVIVCGYFVDCMPGRLRRSFLICGAAVISLSIVIVYLKSVQQTNRFQRATLDVVHKAFPERVPYIDRCSMVSSFRKEGFFMSRWGISDYYINGKPVMNDIINDRQPRFVLANREMLDIDGVNYPDDAISSVRLFPEDAYALRKNYIHHWGGIYVAGKHIEPSYGQRRMSFDIKIEGIYTVETSTIARINGKQVEHGAVISLTKGRHDLVFLGRPAKLVLRWGNKLYRPISPAPRQGLFFGF